MKNNKVQEEWEIQFDDTFDLAVFAPLAIGYSHKLKHDLKQFISQTLSKERIKIIKKIINKTEHTPLFASGLAGNQINAGELYEYLSKLLSKNTQIK